MIFKFNMEFKIISPIREKYAEQNLRYLKDILAYLSIFIEQLKT